MSNLDVFVAGLHSAKGFGPASFKKFINHFGSIQDFYKNSKYNLKFFESRYKKVIKEALNFNVEERDKLLKKFSLKIVYFHQKGYPALLKFINDPPIGIYYKGNIKALEGEKIISVVGTRKSTNYGKKVISEFFESIQNYNFTLCSGLASGIDSIAHEESLKRNIANIAILASSPHRSIPVANTQIYNKILDMNGVVVSEFGPNEKLYPGMFANRNRLIAGISPVSLIVEAPKKSGALITARLANEYNREVLAVPGKIYDRSSEGCNNLIIQNLASLYINPGSILESFDLSYKTIKSNMSINLTNEQKKLYDLMSNRPINIDELAEITSLTTEVVLNICLELELLNVLAKDKSGRYTLV